MSYTKLYKNSIDNPEKFWQEQAKNISWYKEPTVILSKDKNDYPQWFEDGELNICYLCIDKHIEDGFGEQIAIIYDSPVTNTKQKINFNQLQQEVSKLAGGLQSLGLQKGDTTIIYMPMIPQAIYAILACARIGVTHSVVFGGFAPKELSIRIDDCQPKAIITASNGIEINKIIPYKPYVDKAIQISSHQPQHVITFDRKQNVEIPKKDYDIDFEELCKKSKPAAPVAVKSTHPNYILYTSGTTGKPKGVIRDTGGHAVAMKFSIQNIYAVNPEDVFWAASDLGWAVGHSYTVYAPLINRSTTVLFEGKPIKTPDASTFWRIISEYKVKTMFTAPTAIRAIIKEDPQGKFIFKYDLSHYKFQFLAGERCDVTTLNWLEQKLNIPVIDHWWQTESGWPMLANMAGLELQEIKPGSAGLPVCGYDIQILNEEGEIAADDTEGLVAIKLPLPPGCLTDIWRNNARFKAGYFKKFPGYYFSGDGGYKDEDGYVFITGRVDDIINVAGHRLSTAEMEEIVASHPTVAECAVIGIHCDIKGQIPIGLIVLKSDVDTNHNLLEKEIIQRVRTDIGAVASFKKVLVVERLPKTRSGKILRKLLRNIADEINFNTPSTIDDPKIISEIQELYQQQQIGRFTKN
ncbi:propionyl-CoA synthetase [Mesonia phycicola]|uniref:Propionyl-CoA synthetase n=1 Tax=Mesonia phycicola TaxID=579105 RepID=A0A1M6ATN2_9FLAO|nr:AMP-binding protein [Mesonia phycicola]SHI39835.1 propionyl-CoA synthetase [Mesonia phycicola]